MPRVSCAVKAAVHWQLGSGFIARHPAGLRRSRSRGCNNQPNRWPQRDHLGTSRSRGRFPFLRRPFTLRAEVVLMQRTIVWAIVACGLGCGCGNDDSSGGGSSGSSALSGAPTGGHSGAAGQSPAAGAGSGGHSGGAGGVPNSGASGGANGGAGAPSGGHASGNGGGGAETEWPAWVQSCKPLRNAICGDCTSSECLVCIYGTDEELQSTGVSCDQDPRNYKDYCTCLLSGCPPLCREEWR